MEIINFELNNWWPDDYYPNCEPFISYVCFLKERNYYVKFRDTNWIKENKLVIVETIEDMSVNFCVTATKSWVEENCPEILTKYSKFIRTLEEGEDKVRGDFGCPFLDYTEENIGYHFFEWNNDLKDFEEIIEERDRNFYE